MGKPSVCVLKEVWVMLIALKAVFYGNVRSMMAVPQIKHALDIVAKIPVLEYVG